MTEYTPTTEEVRGDYEHFQVPGGTNPVTGEFAEGLAEFDRWLNEIRAEAWDEGYWNGLADGQTGYNAPDNPYRTNEK